MKKTTRKFATLLMSLVLVSALVTSAFAGTIDPLSMNSVKSGDIVTLSVTLLQQETSYYCGPASVQMVLSYLGHTVSQNTLATDLGCTTSGTAVSGVAGCLNSYLGSGYYQTNSSYSYDTAYGLIKGSIDAGNPAICNVQTSKLSYYGGHASKHYIVVSGYMWAQGSGSGTQQLFIKDPNYTDAYYGSFRVDATEVDEALDANAGYFWTSTK